MEGGREQVLRKESSSRQRLHLLEMVSCRNNKEQRRKCSLVVLLSGSLPSPFNTTVVHKTSSYTSATSQDDFEYWTHLWQINVCVCAHVSFVCTHMCEYEYACVCLCVVRGCMCACINTCVNVHVCTNACRCRCIYMNVHVRVHMHVHACVGYAIVCAHIYVHTLVCVWMCTCMPVHVCVTDGLG